MDAEGDVKRKVREAGWSGVRRRRQPSYQGSYSLLQLWWPGPGRVEGCSHRIFWVQ